jgi:replicative DNA helicase
MDEYTLEIERQLLSVCAWEREAYKEASATLGADDFSESRHREIFAAIRTLATDMTRSQMDPISVKLELLRVGRLDEAGGVAYLAEVTAPVAGPWKLPGLVASVAAESLRRTLLAHTGTQVTQLRDRSVPFDEIACHLRELAVRAAAGAAPPEDHSIGASLDALLATFEHPESDPGLPTGIPELDEVIGGLQPGHLITIAGATGSGKTSLGSQIATGAAHAASRNPGRFGAPPGKIASILYFSYEMSRSEIYLRLVAQCSPVEAAFRKGLGWRGADKPIAIAGARRIAELPLFVFDHSGPTVEEVRAEIDRFAVTNGSPGLVIIDYIGLMSTPGFTNDVQGIGHITAGLKGLARDHHVPVIQLAQINREAAARDGKDGHRPRLSDLRSSGSIENDSNVVLLVYRPSYYIQDPEERRRVESAGAPVEVNVAKNRSGENGALNMVWVGRRFLFVPDPNWVSKFGPVDDGHGFIEYPALAGVRAEGPAGRVIAAVTAHSKLTGTRCPRSALIAAFGLSAKAKWVDTRVLAPTVDAMVKTGQLLTGTENRTTLYWLPGQFPPALVSIDGGQQPPVDGDDAADAIFG